MSESVISPSSELWTLYVTSSHCVFFFCGGLTAPTGGTRATLHVWFERFLDIQLKMFQSYWSVWSAVTLTVSLWVCLHIVVHLFSVFSLLFPLFCCSVVNTAATQSLPPPVSPLSLSYSLLPSLNPLKTLEEDLHVKCRLLICWLALWRFNTLGRINVSKPDSNLNPRTVLAHSRADAFHNKGRWVETHVSLWRFSK